jgi:hypothetical protein
MAPVATKRRFFLNGLVYVRVRARPPGIDAASAVSSTLSFAAESYKRSSKWL